jgi:hypothetical protein
MNMYKALIVVRKSKRFIGYVGVYTDTIKYVAEYPFISFSYNDMNIMLSKSI